MMRKTENSLEMRYRGLERRAFNKHITRLLPGTKMHSRVLMALALEDSTTIYEGCLGLSHFPFMGRIRRQYECFPNRVHNNSQKYRIFIATCSDSPVIKF